MDFKIQKPTVAFVMVSWGSFILGVGAYLLGLWNSMMELNEKGYYFALLLFSLFSAISVQKNVRDNLEGLKVSSMYILSSRVALVSAVVLFFIGLKNAELLLSEKGFFTMAFILSLFSVVTIQKNVRDIATFPVDDSDDLT
ncbi:inner membrane protein YiaA [Vibrio lentus]|uniref:inner membrane protein YiaA n=1 Tax=Vibrio lentus TaxID=136468 RepID=UPI0007EEA9DA|nr:inner membrane protein YiaA [Vibrio lentus]MCL4110733.1 hypothetical protein [Idotea baltica]OBT27863.1 hypothetical protein A9266_04140 [Vibrio tasmaniensis]PMG22553.1 hypothetical protein BCU96_17340 [Vibrio lentus]PMH14944.1 hypothetical protein BCU76_15310 [Vibrio lentus]PMI41062.1 hypothetical protein BCU45_19735 [Vibrio lentus]